MFILSKGINVILQYYLFNIFDIIVSWLNEQGTQIQEPIKMWVWLAYLVYKRRREETQICV